MWLQNHSPYELRHVPREQASLDFAALARLLPELLRLNDAQAGLGTGPRGWPGLLTRTLTTGGDGYCLHATLQAMADTRDLLRALRRIGDRCGPAIPAGDNFVHYDFTLANLLSDGHPPPHSSSVRQYLANPRPPQRTAGSLARPMHGGRRDGSF